LIFLVAPLTLVLRVKTLGAPSSGFEGGFFFFCVLFFGPRERPTRVAPTAFSFELYHTAENLFPEIVLDILSAYMLIMESTEVRPSAPKPKQTNPDSAILCSAAL